MKIYYILIIFISFQVAATSPKYKNKLAKKTMHKQEKLASRVKNLQKNRIHKKSQKKHVKLKLASSKRALSHSKNNQYWEKKDLLPLSTYKPKKSAKELSKLLKIQLNTLESVCKAPKASINIQTNIKTLMSFLNKQITENPYMDSASSIKFSLMFEILKDSFNPEISLESFKHKYRYMFNEDASEKFSEQAQDWAVSIERALKCAKQK